MKTKLAIVALVSALLISMLAGCGKNNNNNAGTTTGGGKKVTVKIFQFKVEIAKALEKMKGDYEKDHPNVKLQFETAGGGTDYGAMLKSKLASGDMPDIFNNGGNVELESWKEHLEDLSDQPWAANVSDLAKQPMTSGGKLYGQPMGLEGYGFLYNKDLFAKAGITKLPANFTELSDAAKKLKAAGITPFANGYQEWWILGIHNANIPFANQPDPIKFVDDLKASKTKITGNAVFKDWVKLLDLTTKYSNKNPLTTDYNTEVTMFANGEAAMTQQGNWTQVQILQTNPNIKMGILPMPISDSAPGVGKIYVGVSNNWVIYNKSKVKPEAKEFLNWLVTSDVGQKYITEEFKFIPALTNIKADASVLGELAGDVIKYNADGNVLPWTWTRWPEGTTNEYGSTIQAYIAKKINANEMFSQFQKTWDNLNKKK